MQPECTTQLDIGLQFNGAKVDAWASLYAGRVQDFILFDYTTGMMGSATRAHNVDARIRGGEAGIDWRPAQGWKLSGAASYAWGEVRDTGTALPQMPHGRSPAATRLTRNSRMPRSVRARRRD